ETPAPSAELRTAVEERLARVEFATKSETKPSPRRSKARFLGLGTWAWTTIGGLALGLIALLMLPAVQFSRESARRTQSTNTLRQLAIKQEHDTVVITESKELESWNASGYAEVAPGDKATYSSTMS